MATAEAKLWLPGSPGSWVEHAGILIVGGGYAAKNAIYAQTATGGVDIVKMGDDQILKTKPAARSPFAATAAALSGSGAGAASRYTSSVMDGSDYTRVVGIATTDVAGATLYVQQSKVNPFVAGKFYEYAYAFKALTVHNTDGTTANIYYCAFDEQLGSQFGRIFVQNGVTGQGWFNLEAWMTTVVR